MLYSDFIAIQFHNLTIYYEHNQHIHVRCIENTVDPGLLKKPAVFNRVYNCFYSVFVKKIRVLQKFTVNLQWLIYLNLFLWPYIGKYVLFYL